MDEFEERDLQRVLVAIGQADVGVILAWDGDEIAHEVLLLGVDIEEHFAEPPQAPGLWVWEGIIEPPYLPATMEENSEVQSSAVWTGKWRNPTEEELDWFGLYGRNPWKQSRS